METKGQSRGAGRVGEGEGEGMGEVKFVVNGAMRISNQNRHQRTPEKWPFGSMRDHLRVVTHKRPKVFPPEPLAARERGRCGCCPVGQEGVGVGVGVGGRKRRGEKVCNGATLLNPPPPTTPPPPTK